MTCAMAAPDPFSRRLDVAVGEMGVAHRHLNVGMAKQAGDDRHRRLRSSRRDSAMVWRRS